MKKVLTIATIFVMLMGILAVTVKASTADSVETIYAIGSKYGMTAADKQELQNFIDRNGITEVQTKKLVEKAQEAEAVMTAAGTTNYNDLTSAQKEQLKAIANEAASEVGVSLVFKTKSVEVWKDGKLLNTITNNGGKLAYTGNKSNIAIIAVSSVAVIALAAVVIKKRTAVAE